jgi:ATP-binding cassette subfamily B protein
MTETPYGFLWTMIRPYRWYYLAMLLAPLVAGFYDVGNHYAVKLLIDGFSQGDQPENLVWPIVIFILSQVTLDLAWRASDMVQWRSEPFVRQRILRTVIQRVQEKPYSFFQNTPAGTITSRIKGILDGYDHFWAAMHHDLTPKILNTAILTLVLGAIHGGICLCVFIWTLVFVWAMFVFSKKMDLLSFENASHRHDILGGAADQVMNMANVFAFATQEQELLRLDQKVTSSWIPSQIKLYRYQFKVYCLAAVLYWVMLISLFFGIIHLRQTSQISNGDIAFIMGVTLKLSWELWHLVQKMQDFIKNMGDFKSSFELIRDHKPEETIPNSLPESHGLTFDQVSFAYEPKNPVFENFSLFIPEGQKIGVVGLSGAGKSSLASLLLKFFPYHSGRILVGGIPLGDIPAHGLRRIIAWIPQETLLFHRSIGDNIGYGYQGEGKAPLEEVMDCAKMARIHDFIMSLPDQYDSLVGERGIKLSGGQKQRIAIARAFLKKAPILILDEATSSLDSQTEEEIQESLEFLFHKKTVLVIAHRLSTLKKMDQIVVLDRGGIQDMGPHRELIKRDGLYRTLWESQNGHKNISL